MSNIKQQVVFPQSGLNSDDALIYLPNGDSPYRLHIMVSADSQNGALTVMKGNVQVVSQATLTLSRVYATKGSYYNNLTRSIYFFVFSQPYLVTGTTFLYDNRLIRYNEDLGTVDTIFVDTHNWFGLDPKQLLTDIKMIENWLFFNPRTDQPKMIDVVMAYNYTNYPAFDAFDPSQAFVLGDKCTYKGGLFVANKTITGGEDPVTDTTAWDRIGDSYEDESTVGITEFNRAFFAIKIPPVDRITSAYASDITKNFNNVSGHTFRFCHRYQYFDDSFSVTSSYSNITLPVDEELYNGVISGASIRNNYIQLSFSLYSPALVKNVEIFFQEIGLDWRKMTTINRQEQSLLDTVSYTFNFYNNESYPIVAQSLITTIEDAIPTRAEAQEIINKNILCYAGCTEGFNNIPKNKIDVTLTPVSEELTEGGYEGGTRRDNVASGDISQSSGYEGLVFYFYTKIRVATWRATSSLTDGDVYKVTIDGLTAQGTLGSSDINTDTHLALKMSSIINTICPSSVDYATAVITIKKQFSNPVISFSTIFATGAVLTSFSKYTGFKTGTYHPFCIFYYDEALRRSDAQVSTETTVYVPYFNEASLTKTNYRFLINWSVNHAPMEGMRYWRWGKAENRRTPYFVQYIIGGIYNGGAVSDPVVTAIPNTVAIDITPLQTIRTTTTASWNAYPNSLIPQYDSTLKYRVRFLTKETDPAITGTTLGDILTPTYDFEVISVDDTANIIYIATSVGELVNVGENTLIELYTPVEKTAVETFYEFGDLMPIIQDVDGNWIHGGITATQAIDPSPTPATGTFKSGDVYHIMRTPDKPLCTFDGAQLVVGAYHESMWWSDFYSSTDWDKGKLGLESSIGQKYLNIIRYSNTYLQDTKINGITTFEALKYKELNDVYGRIRAIVEVGDTLKCYQEKKASSIQIGRTSYYEATGQTTNVQTQAFVLGTVSYSFTGYGLVFPESVTKNNRYVYFFDVYNGVMCRDSANGIFPISGRYADAGGNADYKMMTYFKTKAKALLESGIENCNVMTAFDEEYKMLFIVFKDAVNHNNNETIVFHEPSDRWITFADFEYSPVDGWNEILELSYSIVQGFENGIGYSWNPLTRFARFDIGNGLGTSAQTPIPGAILKVYLTVGTPTITVSPNAFPVDNDISLLVPTPSLHVSWIATDKDSVVFLATDNGVDVAQDVSVVLVGSGSAWLSSFPSWVMVWDAATQHVLSANENITDGQTISLFPSTMNTSVLRTGFVVFTDDIGNTKAVMVSQNAPTDDPIVIVSKNPLDTSDFYLYGDISYGLCYTASSTLRLVFTVHKGGLGTGMPLIVYYVIARNGVFDSSGELSARDGFQDDKIIDLTYPAVAGEVIIAYLSGSDVGMPTGTQDADINGENLPVTITIAQPTIRISSIWGDVSTMEWLATESGQLTEKTVNLILVGVSGYLVSKPDWVIVEDSITQIYTTTINDGEALWIYPSAVNTGASRIGYVRLGNIYGDRFIITVTQDETLVHATVSVQKNPTDTSSWALASSSGSAINDTNSISITFVPNVPSMGIRAIIGLDYQIWNGGNEVGEGTLNDVLNRTSNTFSLTMTTVVHGGDNIVVYLSLAI